MRWQNDMAQDKHHPTTTLDPRPVPAFATVQQDVSAAETILAKVVADADDPRREKAAHLIAVDPATGRTRLGEIARLAYGHVYQPRTVATEAIGPLTSDMVKLVYEFSEDAGDAQSPLYFLEPTALLEVLETAIALAGLAAEGMVRSTRQLARLARVDDSVVELALERDGIGFQPYGVSLGEMQEMSEGDRLYWYRQWFVFGLDDAPAWLAQFPGFVGREMSSIRAPA